MPAPSVMHPEEYFAGSVRMEPQFAAAREEMLARAKNPRNAVSVPRILWRRILDRIRARLRGRHPADDRVASGDGDARRR